MSATNLLNPNGSNSGVVQNVQTNNPLYNPSVPVIGDLNIAKNARNLKLKDRFYLENSLDGQMKNSDGLSLGANNKYLRRKDYDRQIDPNYLRRQNPKNQKHTEPNDFYDGMSLGYYDLPKRIPRATIGMPTAPIDSLNAYQYKNRFLDNSLPTLPAKPTGTTNRIILPPPPRQAPDLNDKNTIGQDPTLDTRLKEIQDAQDRETLNRNTNNRNSNKAERDRYGDVAISAPHGPNLVFPVNRPYDGSFP
jgi:hypothetical protein